MSRDKEIHLYAFGHNNNANYAENTSVGELASRDKQIEEMAEILCDARHKFVYSDELAEHLYNKGYRKASEGKWRPYKDYFTHRQVGWICSNCSSVTQDLSNGDTDYCPHCGAVMETESEGADDV